MTKKSKDKIAVPPMIPKMDKSFPMNEKQDKGKGKGKGKKGKC